MGKLFHYIICGVLIFLHSSIHAQPGFFVPIAGKIFFNGDSATIFSNVFNYGNFGVGRQAFVDFAGKAWINHWQSRITDESNGGNGVSGIGGWIRFRSDSMRQTLDGGYNAALKLGPSFPRLRIQNRMGIELTGSSAKVRKEITFSDGLFYLRDQLLAIGSNDPGKINGYDSSRYFVTGNKPESGLLIRENIRSADGQVVFPVGSRANAYTPAAVKNLSPQGDDYLVSVFDDVKSGLFTGNSLPDKGVNKTWEIGKINRPDLDKTEIYLQHLNADEGSYFNQHREYTYVSRFNGIAWDTGSPQNFPITGYLNSGPLLPNSGVNSRIFFNTVSTTSYFTKFTGFGDSLLQTKLWFNARRTGYNSVYVYWKTKPEFRVNYFIVQRRLSNENDFSNRDTVYSLVNGNYSAAELNYSSIDDNSYKGISFYRLQMFNLDSSFVYSYIVAVGGIPDRSLNMIWPNPTPDRFFVSVDPVWRINAIVIWNAAGQKVKQEFVNRRTIIEMGGLIPGTYFVGLVRVSGEVVETFKLVVTGR